MFRYLVSVICFVLLLAPVVAKADHILLDRFEWRLGYNYQFDIEKNKCREYAKNFANHFVIPAVGKNGHFHPYPSTTLKFKCVDDELNVYDYGVIFLMPYDGERFCIYFSVWDGYNIIDDCEYEFKMIVSRDDPTTYMRERFNGAR